MSKFASTLFTIGSGAGAQNISVGRTIGAGLSVLGFIQQSQQAKLQAEIFKREAERRDKESQVEAGEFGRSSNRLLARQRALRGASGVQVGTGTSLDLAEDTAAEAEFQRLKILSGGAADVSRLKTQSTLERRRARSILLSGAGKTFGSFFGP